MMVLGILLGAVFGAIFGYLLGWFVELFPNFNSALLEGISTLTGIGGIRTTALLAAIGFICGLLAGLLGEIGKKR